MQLNRCNLAGNLGGDTQVKYTAGGKPVVSFTMAVNSGWGEKQKTAWCRIAVFGKTAEYLVEHPGFKGDLAFVINAEYEVYSVAPKNGSDEQVKEYHSFCVGYGSECWILPKGERTTQPARSSDDPTAEAPQNDDDDLPF